MRAGRRLALGLASVLLPSGGTDGGPSDFAETTGGGGDARPSLGGQTGGELPDVTLDASDASDAAGEPLDLGELKGPAVVNLGASWCTPCRKELPYYQAFAEAHEGSVPVIGIDFQDTQTDRARELVEDTGVSYPLYSDPDGLTRAQVLPRIVLAGADGEVAHQQYVEIEPVQQRKDLVADHLGVGR